MSINNALADIAPPEPPSGTNPVPGNELTNVRMIAETVLIQIDANSPLDDGLAKATATFTMRNLGEVDERMDVRFPLDQTIGWGKICASPLPQFPPIADLQAMVNNQLVTTQKTYQSITIEVGQEPYSTITIPCWEQFPVSFPAGEDVIIRVSYTTEPYHSGDAAYEYAYVLETGVGWKDTIGRADIIFQLPYELNDSNFYSCWPKDCLVNETKVKWHYEDFEPSSNLGLSLLPPPLWQRIVAERENTTRNPNDGEAWGRLGKAYKEAIVERRGFRSDPAGIEMYRLSVEAYQQAVTLLPNDADWHYGFAQLLCWNAEWNNFLVDSNTEAWRACVGQIQQAININPDHKEANELLLYVAQFNGIIDLSGSQPDYLILTPQPTAIETSPVITTIPTQTVALMTATPLVIAQNTMLSTSPATTVTTTSQISETSNMPIYIGAIALLSIIFLAFVKFRKK